MKKDHAPRYVRFARAVALVTIAAPMPAVLVLDACSDSSTSSPQPVTGGGSNPGPETGTSPAMSTGTSIPLQDASFDATADSSDAHVEASAGDAADEGGGPHRGTPELPASFLA